MGLGLDQLTDDQLLELVQEACIELGARDPYVRNLAQQTITTEAERLALRRQAIETAVAKLCKDYVSAIRTESLAEVRKAVASGELRLLTAAQEARVVVETTLEAKITLIDETVAAIQQGKIPQQPDPDTFEELKRRSIEQFEQFQKFEEANRAAILGSPRPQGFRPPRKPIQFR